MKIPGSQPKLPEGIFVELTNICNCSCTFCADPVMTRERGMMDFGLYCKIVDDASESGIKYFNLWLMGEPTLHPRLFDCIEYARQKGIGLCLITNGLRLNELSEYLFTRRPSNVGTVIISYQTPDAESFRLRQARGIDFDSWEQNVIGFVKKSVESNSDFTVMIRIIVNSRTSGVHIDGLLSETADIRSVIEKWFSVASQVSPHKAAGFTASEHSSSTLEGLIRYGKSFEVEILPHILLSFIKTEDWSNTLIPASCSVLPLKRGWCNSPFEMLGVLWDGSCTMCCNDYDGEMNVGNVVHASLSDVWHGQKIQTIRKAMSKGVLVEPMCQVCRGIVYRKGSQPRLVRGVALKVKRYIALCGVRATVRRGLRYVGSYVQEL